MKRLLIGLCLGILGAGCGAESPPSTTVETVTFKSGIDYEHWISALKHEDPTKRREAAKFLGEPREETPEQVVPALGATVKDADPGVRKQALESLGQLGPPAARAIPALIDVLKDGDDEMRGAAAQALGRIGPSAKPAVPPLIDLLKDRNERVRREAAHALGEIGPKNEDVSALSEALKDDDEGVRRESAHALGAIGPEARAAVGPLVEGLKDTRIRSSVAEALGNIGPESKEAVPALVEMLQDEEDGDRWKSAQALGKIGPEARAAVPTLIEALADDRIVGPEPQTWIRNGQFESVDRDFAGVTVASHAATALARIGPSAVPDLIEVLRGKDTNRRRISAKILGRVGPAARQAVPWLRPLLKDETAPVRQAAARALEQIDPAEAAEAGGR